jgi:hypothetical protein
LKTLCIRLGTEGGCPISSIDIPILSDGKGGAKPSTLGANLPTTCGSEPCRDPTLARRLAVRYRCLIAAHRGRCHINSVGPLSTVCSGDQAAMATEFH